MKRFTLSLIFIVLTVATGAQALETGEGKTFRFTVDKVMQGTPEEVFDKATGDIKGWWDHSVSENPHQLYVEPKAGGAFMEIFDAEGNGVRHAVVTGAHRGKVLRYEGPLGLAGHALFMVTTWTFVDEGEGKTRVYVEVHGAGEIVDGWPGVIEETWEHFLGRLQGYCLGK